MTADQFPDMNGLRVSTSLLSKTPDPPNSNGLRPIGRDSVTSIWCMVVPRIRGPMRLRGMHWA